MLILFDKIIFDYYYFYDTFKNCFMINNFRCYMSSKTKIFIIFGLVTLSSFLMSVNVQASIIPMDMGSNNDYQWGFSPFDKYIGYEVSEDINGHQNVHYGIVIDIDNVDFQSVSNTDKVTMRYMYYAYQYGHYSIRSYQWYYETDGEMWDQTALSSNVPIGNVFTTFLPINKGDGKLNLTYWAEILINSAFYDTAYDDFVVNGSMLHLIETSSGDYVNTTFNLDTGIAEEIIIFIQGIDDRLITMSFNDSINHEDGYSDFLKSTQNEPEFNIGEWLIYNDSIEGLNGMRIVDVDTHFDSSYTWLCSYDIYADMYVYNESTNKWDFESSHKIIGRINDFGSETISFITIILSQNNGSHILDIYDIIPFLTGYEKESCGDNWAKWENSVNDNEYVYIEFNDRNVLQNFTMVNWNGSEYKEESFTLINYNPESWNVDKNDVLYYKFIRAPSHAPNTIPNLEFVKYDITYVGETTINNSVGLYPASAVYADFLTWGWDGDPSHIGYWSFTDDPWTQHGTPYGSTINDWIGGISNGSCVIKPPADIFILPETNNYGEYYNNSKINGAITIGDILVHVYGLDQIIISQYSASYVDSSNSMRYCNVTFNEDGVVTMYDYSYNIYDMKVMLVSAEDLPGNKLAENLTLDYETSGLMMWFNCSADIDLEDIHYTIIDFGDGSSESYTGLPINVHSFISEGNYEITIDVYDTNGDKVSTNINVIVERDFGNWTVELEDELIYEITLNDETVYGKYVISAINTFNVELNINHENVMEEFQVIQSNYFEWDENAKMWVSTTDPLTEFLEMPFTFPIGIQSTGFIMAIFEGGFPLVARNETNGVDLFVQIFDIMVNEFGFNKEYSYNETNVQFKESDIGYFEMEIEDNIVQEIALKDTWGRYIEFNIHKISASDLPNNHIPTLNFEIETDGLTIIITPEIFAIDGVSQIQLYANDSVLIPNSIDNSSFSFSFSESGTYDVTIVVVDNNGDTVTLTKEIQVSKEFNWTSMLIGMGSVIAGIGIGYAVFKFVPKKGTKMIGSKASKKSLSIAAAKNIIPRNCPTGLEFRDGKCLPKF